jgi:hypothetical protein
MLNGAMAKPILNCPRIHSLGRQGVSGRVPQHVHMNRERQFGGLASPFDHAADAHATERLGALIDEDVSGFYALGLLLAPQQLDARQFIAVEVMAAIDAALEPAHNDRALGQVEVVPAQLRDAFLFGATSTAKDRAVFFNPVGSRILSRRAVSRLKCSQALQQGGCRLVLCCLCLRRDLSLLHSHFRISEASSSPLLVKTRVQLSKL